jgi:hypothetical protein
MSFIRRDFKTHAPSPNRAEILHPGSRAFEVELEYLPYYVCEDLIDIWIGIIQPGINYSSGLRPVWWPESVPFKKPQRLHKFGMSPTEQ